MTIPTEPIRSIPRPLQLIETVAMLGEDAHPKLEPLYDVAIRDTIERFEALERKTEELSPILSR